MYIPMKNSSRRGKAPTKLPPIPGLRIGVHIITMMIYVALKANHGITTNKGMIAIQHLSQKIQ